MKSRIVLEYDNQSETGYTLTMDDYSEHFGAGESRERFKDVESFRFVCACGDFLARKEWRGRYPFWYAYKRFGRQLKKVYLGRPHRLTLAGLEDAAALLYSRRDCEPYVLG